MGGDAAGAGDGEGDCAVGSVTFADSRGHAAHQFGGESAAALISWQRTVLDRHGAQNPLQKPIEQMPVLGAGDAIDGLSHVLVGDVHAAGPGT